MSELVDDCLRCGAKKVTFELLSEISTKTDYGWKRWYEAFCICRSCCKSTVFVLVDSRHGDHKTVKRTGLSEMEGMVNCYVDVRGRISLKDVAGVEPPEHIPANIESVFREGATNLATSCNNSAGTMFRLCIDLVTREFLHGKDEGAERPNHRTRRDLGLRLLWLFDNGILDESLRDLSTCVREDGNDGSHQGTLTKGEATDLLDFTVMLLERIYTEPARLRLAQERRDQRRKNAEGE